MLERLIEFLKRKIRALFNRQPVLALSHDNFEYDSLASYDSEPDDRQYDNLIVNFAEQNVERFDKVFLSNDRQRVKEFLFNTFAKRDFPVEVMHEAILISIEMCNFETVKGAMDYLGIYNYEFVNNSESVLLKDKPSEVQDKILYFIRANFSCSSKHEKF